MSVLLRQPDGVIALEMAVEASDAAGRCSCSAGSSYLQLTPTTGRVAVPPRRLPPPRSRRGLPRSRTAVVVRRVARDRGGGLSTRIPLWPSSALPFAFAVLRRRSTSTRRFGSRSRSGMSWRSSGPPTRPCRYVA